MTVRGTAISLFSGAGGLDLRRRAGRLPAAAAVETNGRRRRHDGQELPQPFSAQSSAPSSSTSPPGRFPGRRRPQRPREPPDLLVGGPPCTPFSKSGFWLDGSGPARPRRQPAAGLHARARRGQATRLHSRERLRPHLQQQGQPAGVRAAARARSTTRATTASGRSQRRRLRGSQLRPRLFVVGTPRDEGCPSFPSRRTVAAGNGARPVGTRPHVTAGEALAGLVTNPSPKRSCGASGATSSPTSLRATTTSTTPPNAGTPSPSSSGAAATGHSCSSSTRTGRHRRSRPSQAPTSDRFTGRTAASASRRSSASSPSPTTSHSWAGAARSRPRSATPFPPLLARQVTERVAQAIR